MRNGESQQLRRDWTGRFPLDPEQLDGLAAQPPTEVLLKMPAPREVRGSDFESDLGGESPGDVHQAVPRDEAVGAESGGEVLLKDLVNASFPLIRSVSIASPSRAPPGLLLKSIWDRTPARSSLYFSSPFGASLRALPTMVVTPSSPDQADSGGTKSSSAYSSGSSAASAASASSPVRASSRAYPRRRASAKTSELRLSRRSADTWFRAAATSIFFSCDAASSMSERTWWGS